MAGNRDYESGRLHELILYIADRSRLDSRFGNTKLNKILFFADFTARRELGRSITGAVYQHLKWGPAPQQMLPALDELTSGGRAVVKADQTYGGTQKRVVPIAEPDLTMFTGSEIAIVERVIEELMPMTNIEVSERSHQTAAWRLTELDQEIPYGAAMHAQERPTNADLEWLAGVTGDELVDA